MTDKVYEGLDRNNNEIWIRNSDKRRCCSKNNCLMVYVGYGLCDTHYRHAKKDGSICLDKVYNKYTEKDGYIEVTVNNSDEVYKIDPEYVEYAKSYNWYSYIRSSENYPYLTAKAKVDGKWKHIKYHIEIMQEEIEKYKKENNYNKRIIVDHKNGDPTDNRKCNLRIRTQSENNMNKEIQSNNSTGIVGVSWHSRNKTWDVKISKENKVYNIGEFCYLRNAVKARIKAEEELFGEHALRKRENNDYDDYIQYILSLPEIKEPIFRKRPDNEFKMLGIRRKKNGKYVGYIYLQEICNHISKTFNGLEEAIKWRKDKEIEVYGQVIRYHDEKEEKQI